MINKNTIGNLIYINIYLIIIGFFIVKTPSNLTHVLAYNYLLYIIAYFIMGLLFLTIVFRTKASIFDPIVFISIIYIPMFTIVPMIDIIINEILWFGVDLFEHGFKGTILAVIGYIMFSIGYVITIKQNNTIKREQVENYDNLLIIRISLFIWFLSLVFSVAYLLSNGMSILYAMTLGFVGDFQIDRIMSTSLGFLSMFSYCLIPTSLVYSVFGKSKILKSLVFALTIIVQLVRGFRFIVIIMLFSYFYYFYISKRKQPSMKTVFLCFFLVIILIGVMGFYRGAIRIGATLSWSDFNSTDVIEAIIGNFRIYKTYYAVIKAVPDLVPYMFGNQMIIYTLVMFIPRVLWSGKPSPSGLEAIEVGISNYAAKAGQAYPNIGEFYYEFGVIGIIVFMWLFGVIMRSVKNKLLYSDDKFNLIMYSIIVPTTLQLIIRGYTPSNFYLVIFLILPIFIIKYYSKVKRYNHLLYRGR